MSKYGWLKISSILKKYIYKMPHNFSLLSMARLLHNQDWKIMLGDISLIQFEIEKGKVIEFEIVVPTLKGAIYAADLSYQQKWWQPVLRQGR